MKSLLLFVLTFLTLSMFAVDFPFTVNGKNYKIVTTQKNWADAAAWAVQDGGYLVHINSQMEQDSIWAAIQASGISTTYTTVNDGGGIAYIWIGATDRTTEGSWIWDGNGDNSGVNFYTGQGQNGTANGAAVGGAFINWGGKSAAAGATTNEPDDFFSNQDAAAIALAGWPAGTTMLGIPSEWNDIAATNTLYFIVEYESVGQSQMEEQEIFNLLINPESGSLDIASSISISQIKVITIEGKIIHIYHPNNEKVTLTRLPSGILFIESVLKNGIIRRDKILIN